jgi:N-acetylglucosamine-6-sulfatase
MIWVRIPPALDCWRNWRKPWWQQEKMSRNLVIQVVVFALAFTTHGADAAPRPNIIFILVDDLRWDDLGCAGHPFSHTPNIDRIAREGALFRNAFATTPLCSPSRASILTSEYAHIHGITDNTDRSAQSHRLKTFPQELQKAGYETAFFGKWHMGNDNTPRRGFDRWYCLQGQGSTFDPLVNDDGRNVQTHGYVTDILNEKSLEFIRKPHSRPYLVYLSHKAMHPETSQGPDGKLSDPYASNFIPAPRHKDLYVGAKIPRRANWGVPPNDKPALQQKIAGLPPLSPETGSSDTVILNRLRMLASVDEGLDQILKTLADNDQLDNTLIVVTGDHGYFYGEHCLSVERRLAYEESIRVPIVMRYPKLIKAGSTPEGFALTIDFAPTFVELAGGKIPEQYQGRSLVPLLKGEAPKDWRKSILVEYFSDTVFPRAHKMGYQCVRNDRWKYIHYTDLPGADELYDLANDLYELKNVFADPAASRSLAEMQEELKRLLTETGAKEVNQPQR